VADGQGGQRAERLVSVRDGGPVVGECCLATAAAQLGLLPPAGDVPEELLAARAQAAEAAADRDVAVDDAAMVRAHLGEWIGTATERIAEIETLKSELAARDELVGTLPGRVAELEQTLEGVRAAHVDARDQMESWRERAESAEAALEETRRHDATAESTTIQELQARIKEMEAAPAAKFVRRERTSAGDRQ
jgi:chromosome segregation ATPase